MDTLDSNRISDLRALLQLVNDPEIKQRRV